MSDMNLADLKLDSTQYDAICEIVNAARENGKAEAKAEAIQQKELRGVRVVVQRKTAGSPDYKPRKIRLTGVEGGRQKKAGETQEEYWKSTPHLTLHADEFVKLAAGAILPVLDVITSVGHVQTVRLPSYYDGQEDYGATVGIIEGKEEPVAIRLSKYDNLDAGQNCIQVAAALKEALEQLVESNHIPEPNADILFNFGEPTNDYQPQNGEIDF